WQNTSTSSSPWPRTAGKRSGAEADKGRRPPLTGGENRAAMLGRPPIGLDDSGSHFLSLEEHIADHEHHDHAGNHANHLRPGDKHAFAKRQWGAQDGALQLAEIDRAQRSCRWVEDR